MSSTLGSSTIARDPLLAVANGMVRLYKETFGRGPRRAWASYAGSDSLLVLLERTLTTAEHNLASLGEDYRLRETRLLAQSALEPRARALVEDALRRRTVAFATGVDPDQDVVAVFFTLGPPIESPDRRQQTHAGA